MKAQEYFDKYLPLIEAASKDNEEAVGRIACDMLNELHGEYGVLLDNRCKQYPSYKAARAIVLELNKRWNSIAAKFESHFGYSFLLRNAYLSVIEQRSGLKICPKVS